MSAKVGGPSPEHTHKLAQLFFLCLSVSLFLSRSVRLSFGTDR